MKHAYIDKYSDLDSLIHKLDPRIKIITLFVFIFFVIFTPLEVPRYLSVTSRFSWGLLLTGLITFALYGTLIAILIILSKVPLTFILKRSLVIIPFVLMTAIFIPFFKKGEIAGGYSFGTFKVTLTYDGIMIFWNVLVKAYLCILSMILLVASTKLSNLLKALEKLRLPPIFIMILSFMYRYIFVVVDELMKMRQAKEARTINGSRWLHFKTLTNMIGVLFVRTYERAESVYLAMCARGFDGSIKTINSFHLKMKDLCFLVVIIGLLTGIRILGR